MFFTGVPVLETPLLWFVDLQFSEEEILLKFSPTPPSSGSSWMCHWCRGEHCVYQHFRPKFGGKTRTLHKIALIDQLRAVFFHRKANLKRLKEREIPNSCRGRVWPRAMSSVRNRERKEHNDQWCSVRYSRCEVLGKRSRLWGEWRGNLAKLRPRDVPLVVYSLSSLGVKALSESWKMAAPRPRDPEHPCGDAELTVTGALGIHVGDWWQPFASSQWEQNNCILLWFALYSAPFRLLFFLINNEPLPIHSVKLHRQSPSSFAWERCTMSCCERSGRE